MLAIIIIVLFFLHSPYGICKKYYNHTVYRAFPVNQMHLSFIENLGNKYDINFWKRPNQIHNPVDFSISPLDHREFLLEAEEKGIYLTKLLDDLQSAFDNQTVKYYVSRKTETFNWNAYFRLKDIYEWLRDLARLHPQVMEVQVLGKSEGGTDILAVKIAKTKNPKSTVIIESGIHAREWIAPAVTTFLIKELLHAENSNNDLLSEISRTFEWYIVPLLNVDGYEFTHTTDRLWRRNIRGVDLNRNFDSAFGTIGSSFKKDDETYCGEKPFSEAESAAMAKLVTKHGDKLSVYMAFHSYGQYIIVPYGHKIEHMENYDEVHEIATKAAASIAKVRGTKYIVGTTSDTVGYKASGVSGDWVKSRFRVPYVITLELPDKGEYGFALPPDRILPTCRETLEGVLSFFSDPRVRKTQREYQVKMDAWKIKRKDFLIFTMSLFNILNFS